jgi:hypothetical protein
MHTAEPFVPEPSASEFEVAIRKLQVLIRFHQNCFSQEEKECFRNIHSLILLIRKKGIASPVETVKIWCLSTNRVIRLTVIIVEVCHSSQFHIKFYQTFFSLG